jgi:hypothetical protein
MLLKPLGTAKGVEESCWEMPNGYWTASGRFLKGIGKPLGNAQILTNQPIGEEAYFPTAIGKNVAISIPFL